MVRDHPEKTLETVVILLPACREKNPLPEAAARRRRFFTSFRMTCVAFFLASQAVNTLKSTISHNGFDIIFDIMIIFLSYLYRYSGGSGTNCHPGRIYTETSVKGTAEIGQEYLWYQ